MEKSIGSRAVPSSARSARRFSKTPPFARARRPSSFSGTSSRCSGPGGAPAWSFHFGDGSGKVLGFLMASVGIGGIAGGVFTASLCHLERRGILQLAALFLLSLSLAGFAFTRTLSVALLLLGLAGFFEMIFLTTNQTLVQLAIPNRITSVVNLNLALMPLGGMMAGFGSDLLGGPARITVILAGIGAVIPFLLLLFSSTIRNYRLSRAIVPDLAATQSDPHSVTDDHV